MQCCWSWIWEQDGNVIGHTSLSQKLITLLCNECDGLRGRIISHYLLGQPFQVTVALTALTAIHGWLMINRIQRAQLKDGVME